MKKLFTLWWQNHLTAHMVAKSSYRAQLTEQIRNTYNSKRGSSIVPEPLKFKFSLFLLYTNDGFLHKVSKSLRNFLT